MSTDQNDKWAVIFDVDGTMVDNAEYHKAAWIELGSRRGLPITPEFYDRKIHARSNAHIVTMLYDGKADKALIDEVSLEKEIIYRESFAPVAVETPGLTDLLEKLNALDIPCAAASNSPKGNVDMVIDTLDLEKYFKVIINADQVSKGKPDPEIFLTTAGKLGVLPGRCFVFEDSAPGFKAAENAKMAYAAITAGVNSDDISQAAMARGVYTDFTEIGPDNIKTMLG